MNKKQTRSEVAVTQMKKNEKACNGMDASEARVTHPALIVEGIVDGTQDQPEWPEEFETETDEEIG
jgi:hypothetical protein